MSRLIRWEQWSEQFGLERCGIAEYKQIMDWLAELGKDAKRCLMEQDKPHALYGRKIYDDEDNLVEVRMYREVYLTDDALEVLAERVSGVLYVAHK